MAVFERTYKAYTGTLTEPWSRLFIVPRASFRATFQSKLFIVLFVVCLAPLLVMSTIIYLHHNVEVLSLFQVRADDVLRIDANFFLGCMWVQMFFAFALNLFVGPPLIARDIENNGLPLYLCRPFSRAEYMLGKLSVLLALMSLVTWVPLLLLFGLQAYLEGGTWLTENFSIAVGIYVGSIFWILVVALLALAISAWVKWRLIASVMLVVSLLVPSVMANAVNGILQTEYGSLLSISHSMDAIRNGLMGTFVSEGRVAYFNGHVIPMSVPPLWTYWTLMLLLALALTGLLYSRIRAYEVVRS